MYRSFNSLIVSRKSFINGWILIVFYVGAVAIIRQSDSPMVRQSDSPYENPFYVYIFIMMMMFYDNQYVTL